MGVLGELEPAVTEAVLVRVGLEAARLTAPGPRVAGQPAEGASATAAHAHGPVRHTGGLARLPVGMVVPDAPPHTKPVVVRL